MGISNADQFTDIYKSLPGCIGEQAEGIPGGGTYAVPLTASDGSGRTVMNLYLFDTGTDAKGGGYEAFDPAIIDWYRKTRDALKAETGHYVPSLVFQHIPMPEYYHVRPGDMLEEPPSIPDINNGEFDALHEKGDILGVFVGHDHKNSFVGRYKDMDLGFTQSSGFNVYGNRTKRGVRCFVLHEDDPTHYDTYTRTYEELVGTKVHRPVFDYLSSKAPATMDAAIPMIVKTVVGLAVIVALIILLAKLL